MPSPTLASGTPTHLILVCCHAIYLSGPPSSPTSWLLSPFQISEAPTFVAHARAGVNLLASSAPHSAVLVFSGSRTRPETQKSEARGYVDLCKEEEWWGREVGIVDGDDPDGRCDGVLGDSGEVRVEGPQVSGKGERIIALEEKALDSYHNLLFSILRFWEVTGAWPGRITIVSHEFKRARFIELHVPAIRWPMERVGFVGIDPAYMCKGDFEWNRERAEDVREGERMRGYEPWVQDKKGEGAILKGKREGRNYWGVRQGLFENEGKRVRSGVKMRVLDGGQEILSDEVQPWQVCGVSV